MREITYVLARARHTELLRQAAEHRRVKATPTRPKETAIKSTLTARVSYAIARVRRAWAEFDNAQRPLFETQTGTPATRGAAGVAAHAKREADFSRCRGPARSRP